MGNFYVNYTLRGADQKSVAAVLAGRSAIVSPVQDNCVIVFDKESDEQDYKIIAELASWLSGQLYCPLLAVLNHDDDILWYQLYLNGELTDEYDSTPGYFDDSRDEATRVRPKGGDAQKLCSAFAVNSVKDVEDILRKPSHDKNGYIFAVQRHADLAGILGFPEFATSGFDQIDSGEFSDVLPEKDCIRVEEVPAGPSPPVPGYYKINRHAHPGLKKNIPIGWTPTTWAGLECKEQNLSDAFLKATFTYREQFKQLGFTEIGFKKNTRVLNPYYLDNGGINYWNNSRCCHGQLIYSRAYMPSLMSEKERVHIVFTSVFEKEILSCTNNLQKEVAPLPYHKVVRIESNDAGFLYQKFIELLKQQPETPRQFPDLQSLQNWFDSCQFELFADKVRQGLWVPMSEPEVQFVRRRLPPHLLNP